jgi:hypothetical protein
MFLATAQDADLATARDADLAPLAAADLVASLRPIWPIVARRSGRRPRADLTAGSGPI